MILPSVGAQVDINFDDNQRIPHVRGRRMVDFI
jgi:hypothetical protein